MSRILFKTLFFPLLMVLYLASSLPARSVDNAKDVKESEFSSPSPKQDMLISEEYFNNKVADIAFKFYKEFNQNWKFNNKGEKNTINSQNWKYVDIGGEMALTYIGEDNIEGFMDALKGLVNERGVTECARMLQLVQILTAREVMGDDIFKKYLGEFINKNPYVENSFNHKLVVMTISCDYLLKGQGIEIQCIFKKKQMGGVHNGFDVGSFVHLKNIPNYFDFIANGSFMGENLVYMGSDSFMGFGELYKDGPKTRQEIYTAFHEELLTSEKFVSQYGDDFDHFLNDLTPPSYTTLIDYESIKLWREKR